MGDRISMSISIDILSDETLNQGPLALLLRRHYEFPFGINFSAIFIFIFFIFKKDKTEIQDIKFFYMNVQKQD